MYTCKLGELAELSDVEYDLEYGVLDDEEPNLVE